MTNDSPGASSVATPSPSGDPRAEKIEAHDYHTSAEELAGLAPPLAAAAGPAPSWSALLTAAEALRERIGIPERAWNMAFEHLGRIGRLITLADLLSFPDQHFTGSRPAYFQGMVNRAKRGELRLDRALYGMRSRAQCRAADPARHAVSVPMELRGAANYRPLPSAGDAMRRLQTRIKPQRSGR